MIDRILAFAIRHRFLIIAAAVILGLACALALSRTPIDAIPDLSENQVIVFTTWPGHSPREVEDQVTYPLWLCLPGLAGVKAVRSSSDVAFSMINVVFEEGTDLAAARKEVGERLAQAGHALPPGVTPQLGPDALATGQIFWYTVEGSDRDPGQLRELHDWTIRPQLQAVPGVAEVASVGGSPLEYQVEVNPHLLQALGVSVQDVLQAVARSNEAVGAGVVQKGNAEYLVRAIGLLGHRREDGRVVFDRRRALRDLEQATIRTDGPRSVRISDVATVSVGPGPRRGALEKDGSEVTGGVVLMRRGDNPREVIARLKDRIGQMGPGLPAGVRIVPFYDRTPLIDGAIATLTGTLREATLTAIICVLVVLLHFRASLIIALVLPLAAAAPFGVLWLLARLGLADASLNIMALAGIAISIGVLVDAAVVMVENVMHHLHTHFGDKPVRGDVRPLVKAACREVGRPLFFAMLIMLLSFLPVFALGGMEGKMFRPLAWTKSLALAAAALLTITLVPALCTFFLRGRVRSEQASWLVRSAAQVYRPALAYVMERPAVVVWFFGATLLIGLAPLGRSGLLHGIFLGVLFAALAAAGLMARRGWAKIGAMVSLVLIALVARQWIQPLGGELMTPLDEGMVMDMPITVPRASITQGADDLKARDMILCRFPEVAMVVGKVGRGETASDPAPLDMIETMIDFRPQSLWPRRKLPEADATHLAGLIHDALVERKLIAPPNNDRARSELAQQAARAALPVFDLLMRERANQRFQELERARRTQTANDDSLESWRRNVDQVNGELLRRAPAIYTRLAMEELLLRASATDANIVAVVQERKWARAQPPSASDTPLAEHHHGTPARAPSFVHRVIPSLEWFYHDLHPQFVGKMRLIAVKRSELIGFGGELDQAVRMPGWTNVWTRPIQNRVDMLATGVNTAVGVRVLGGELDDVVRTSEAIAARLRKLPGAAVVVADPVRGKGYLEVQINRDKAAHHGVSAGDVNDLVETALGGKVVTMTVEGRARHPVRVRFARDWRQDEETLRRLPVPIQRGKSPAPRHLPLEEVADVRMSEGPAAIKSENGLLRNYVRIEVQGRDAADFVDEARRIIAREVALPAGVFLEWTGQFEHDLQARRTWMIALPLVLLLILGILYLTYRDVWDVLLVMLAIPGALAGGVFFQWWLGYKFSVTVGIGYIACFGMAASTGIIMLVYLRAALARAGGLEKLTLEELRQAVMDGAVKRLRPKLLTEAITILGLAPLLWATGTGAEVIQPMVAPVLGGLLIADEIIDLLLPVLFYRNRRWRWQCLSRQAADQPGAVKERNGRFDRSAPAKYDWEV
jgi:Cu(I)/Ag(I) efflux system membrane protein CusA/SilA